MKTNRLTSARVLFSLLVILSLSAPTLLFAQLSTWKSLPGQLLLPVVYLDVDVSGHLLAYTGNGEILLRTGEQWVVRQEAPVATGEALTVRLPDGGVYFADQSGLLRHRPAGSIKAMPAANGLPDIPLSALAYHPQNKLFALNQHGFLYQLDLAPGTAGATDWIATDLNHVAVNAILATGAGIYAATDTAGIFFSANGVNGWQPSNNGLANREVPDLVQGRNNRLFAATNGMGVFRSEEAPINWVEVNTGITNPVMLSLAVTGDGGLLAGTVGGGVFYSANEGDSWEDRSGSLLAGAVVYDIAVSAAGEVYAGTGNNGLYRSTDNGLTWHPFGLENIDIRALEPDAASGPLAGAWFAGVHRYQNGSWNAIALPNTHVMDFIGTGEFLLAASHGAGIFRSADNGSSWEALNGGLTNAGVWCFARSNDGYVFAGTNGSGVFRSQMPQPTALPPAPVTPGDGFALHQNYPNPFNPATTLQYELYEPADVTVEVFDITGRPLQQLVNGRRNAGIYTVHFDAAGYASGLYFYRLQANGASRIRRMLLVR